MSAKEFRELQVSSSVLGVIFVGILIVGVFIFLLGVSVGKKQAEISRESELASRPEAGTEKAGVPLPAPTESLTGPQEPTTSQEAKEAALKPDVQKEPAPVAPISAPSMQEGLFYVQVSAFQDRPSALASADKFKKRGYPVLIKEPLSGEPKKLFRVRVGGYPTREEALKILAKLKSEAGGKADYFIARD